MGARLGELVERFGGQLHGEPGIEITAIAALDRAGAGDISFLGNSKLRSHAARSLAAALILSPPDDAALADRYAGARIVTDNPYAYFARAAQYLLGEPVHKPPPGIHPSAVVHARARVDPAARIGPLVTVEEGAVVKAGAVIDAGCYIGPEAVVGEDTHFFANVSFLARCVIGERGADEAGADRGKQYYRSS